MSEIPEQEVCEECGGTGRVILEEIYGHVSHWKRCWVCRPVPTIERDDGPKRLRDALRELATASERVDETIESVARLEDALHEAWKVLDE